MDYYDLVRATCDYDRGFDARLGFKRVFKEGNDIGMAIQGGESGQHKGKFMAVGRDMGWLANMIKGGAKALVVERNDADGKLLATMRERGTILLFPMSSITELFGLKRTRAMYFMGNMLKDATKAGVRVGFVSLAASKLQMCSYMQLVELAKLIGASEKQARSALSAVNCELGGDDDA
ncbi:hypothetical protein M1329_00860 [Candidatus Marsarchaeota archaeon]|jgi:hypothetical protein|nr:hypothetical protein [Candidatus Marsarchaeota archaeon]MCL5099611.1 hypothetical protein [Candidatus Marsarchaeota archaeon]